MPPPKLKTCNFRNCKSVGGKKRYFLFRSHDYPAWVKACQKYELLDISKRSLLNSKHVCSDHFVARDFVYMYSPHDSKLSRDAVPKLLSNVDDAKTTSKWIEETSMSFSEEIVEKVLSLGRNTVACLANTTTTVTTTTVNVTNPSLIKSKISRQTSTDDTYPNSSYTSKKTKSYSPVTVGDQNKILKSSNSLSHDENHEPTSNCSVSPPLNENPQSPTYNPMTNDETTPDDSYETTLILKSGSLHTSISKTKESVSPKVVITTPSKLQTSTQRKEPTESASTGESSSSNSLEASGSISLEAIQDFTRKDHHYCRQRDTDSPVKDVDWFNGEIICEETLEDSPPNSPTYNPLTDELTTRKSDDQISNKPHAAQPEKIYQGPQISFPTPKSSNSQLPANSNTIILMKPLFSQSSISPNYLTSCVQINRFPLQSTPLVVSSTPSSNNSSKLPSTIMITSLASLPFTNLSSGAQAGIAVRPLGAQADVTMRPLGGQTNIAIRPQPSIAIRPQTGIAVRPLGPLLARAPTPIAPNGIPNTLRFLSLPPNMLAPLTFVPSNLNSPNPNAPLTGQKKVLEKVDDNIPKMPIARLPNQKSPSYKTHYKNVPRAPLPCPVCVKRKKQEKQNRNNPKFVKPPVPYNLKRFPIEQFCHKYGELLGPYVTEIVRMQLYKNKLWKMRYSRAQLWMAASIMRGVKKFGYKYLKRLFPLPNESTIRREMKRRKEDPNSKDESIWFDELVDDYDVKDFDENLVNDENSPNNQDSADKEISLDHEDENCMEVIPENQIIFDPVTGIVSLDKAVKSMPQAKQKKIKKIKKINKNSKENKKSTGPKKSKERLQHDDSIANSDYMDLEKESLKRKREIRTRELRKLAAKRRCLKFQPLFNVYESSCDSSSIKSKELPEEIKNIVLETVNKIRNPTSNLSSEQNENIERNGEDETNISEEMVNEEDLTEETFHYEKDIQDVTDGTFNCGEDFTEETASSRINIPIPVEGGKCIVRDSAVGDSTIEDEFIADTLNIVETGDSSISNSDLVFEGYVDSVPNNIDKSVSS